MQKDLYNNGSSKMNDKKRIMHQRWLKSVSQWWWRRWWLLCCVGGWRQQQQQAWLSSCFKPTMQCAFWCVRFTTNNVHFECVRLSVANNMLTNRQNVRLFTEKIYALVFFHCSRCCWFFLNILFASLRCIETYPHTHNIALFGAIHVCCCCC